MTSAGTYVQHDEMDRRAILKRVLIGGGVAAAALAAPGFTGVANASEDGEHGHVKQFNLGVTLDFGTFETTGPGTGAFYVSGDISAGNPGGASIGTFYCWGWITSDGAVAVVNQEFKINGRGKIQISGIESHDLRAVIGGTGDFVYARGQGNPHVEDTFGDGDGAGEFLIEFRIMGAKGRPIG